MGFNGEHAVDWHGDIPAIRSLRAPIISAEAVRKKTGLAASRRVLNLPEEDET